MDGKRSEWWSAAEIENLLRNEERNTMGMRRKGNDNAASDISSATEIIVLVVAAVDDDE